MKIQIWQRQLNILIQNYKEAIPIDNCKMMPDLNQKYKNQKGHVSMPPF